MLKCLELELRPSLSCTGVSLPGQRVGGPGGDAPRLGGPGGSVAPGGGSGATPPKLTVYISYRVCFILGLVLGLFWVQSVWLYIYTPYFSL